jgi:hypothetical protein
MELPEILKPESLTKLMQGAALGCAALLVVGFGWGGWVLGSTATAMTEKAVSSAVIAAMAPICADNFQRSPDAVAKLVELKKISTWQQGDFIEKGGWALMPGTKSATAGVTQACATLLNNTK